MVTLVGDFVACEVVETNKDGQNTLGAYLDGSSKLYPLKVVLPSKIPPTCDMHLSRLEVGDIVYVKNEYVNSEYLTKSIFEIDGKSFIRIHHNEIVAYSKNGYVESPKERKCCEK